MASRTLPSYLLDNHLLCPHQRNIISRQGLPSPSSSSFSASLSKEYHLTARFFSSSSLSPSSSSKEYHLSQGHHHHHHPRSNVAGKEVSVTLNSLTLQNCCKKKSLFLIKGTQDQVILWRKIGVGLYGVLFYSSIDHSFQ